MSSIYEQSRLNSLAVALDALVRMSENESDPDMTDAINDAIHAVDKVLAWSGYRQSAERSKDDCRNHTTV